MKNVYRIWCNKSPMYEDEEIGLFSSYKAACNYILSQLEGAEAIGGYIKQENGTKRWFHDVKDVCPTLKQGACWGIMGGWANAYMLASYSIEKVSVMA